MTSSSSYGRVDQSAPAKIALGPDGISIWDGSLFGEAQTSDLRIFLERAFTVPEVRSVDISLARAFGKVRYAPSRDPASVWRRLGHALRGDASSDPKAQYRAGPTASGLFLDAPSVWPLRVIKVGDALSTWRVRSEGDGLVRFGHPLLRRRPDIVFRLEEILSSLAGVARFRISRLTSSVLIQFDTGAQSAARLARELEAAWPHLLHGLEGPPSKSRLYASAGLLGLATVGQFAVPALRPLAVAGVVVLSAPNVVLAARQLRRGEIGLPALYSTGIAFLLLTWMPFSGTLMAFLMQLWPHLTRRIIIERQRRIFAARRRLPNWARVPQSDGLNLEVHVDDLRPGDVVIVRRGEVVPVDGKVVEGVAAVVDELATGRDEIDNIGPGDAVNAGGFLRDGEIVIQVARAGQRTAAAHVARALPHDVFTDLPSSAEAERIANRNARPALALSLLNLIATRTLRPSQAVIRPDYATAPRISARFAALESYVEALDAGLHVRNAAVLDLIERPNLFVFDESAALERKRISVGRVLVDQASAREVLASAVIALDGSHSERADAVRAAFGATAAITRPDVIRRRAGATIFQDDLGQEFAVLSQALLDHLKIRVPDSLARVTRRASAETQLKPLWVIRDRVAVGAVTFEQKGEPLGRKVIAELKSSLPGARLIYLSRKDEALARAVAEEVGIDNAVGGISAQEKPAFIREFSRGAIWIGNGASPGTKAAIEASAVSISVGGLAAAPEDRADILLLGGLAGLVELPQLGAAHRRRLADDYRTVYAANLLGVAGAFLAGFGSLQSGLLSNVGTGLVFARHLRRLNRITQEHEAGESQLRTSIYQ